MSEKMVPEHEQTLHYILEEEIPCHQARSDDHAALFAKNRRLLVEEHDFPCIVPSCRSREGREVHHIAEFCGEPWYDFDRLKAFLMTFDPYGFSKAYHDQPITNAADIRNLLVVCSKCHREGAFAIHRVPFPQFVQEAVVKDGHSFLAVKDHVTNHHDKH